MDTICISVVAGSSITSAAFWFAFFAASPSAVSTSNGFLEGSNSGGQLVHNSLEGGNIGGAAGRGGNRTGGVFSDNGGCATHGFEGDDLCGVSGSLFLE